MEDQKEKYTAFITEIRPHLDSTEDVVVPFSTKVNKLSHRWDELNKELGELEQAMVPWRQLLEARDALEQFLTPLEELFEVECANANQLPLGSDLTPFIVQFKVLIYICAHMHICTCYIPTCMYIYNMYIHVCINTCICIIVLVTWYIG